MTTLQATHRPEKGKGAARRLRAAGKIPAVFYGPNDEPMPVAVDPAQLYEIFKETGNRNTVVDLEIEGQTYPALVREVQRHPLNRDLLHVDLYRLAEDRDIEVMVPVRPVGRPRGAQVGGRLRLIRRVIRVRCRFKDIPADLPVDVSRMWIGDMIRASQIPVPEGVTFVLENDFNVVTVYGKRGQTPPPDMLDAPAEGETAPAEGETAAAE